LHCKVFILTDKALLSLNNLCFNCEGGALYVRVGTFLSVNNTLFASNSAGDGAYAYGGGMYVFFTEGPFSTPGPSPWFSNVTFTANIGYAGAGLAIISYNEYSDIYMSNVTFTKNVAAVVGGGLLLLASQDNQIFNITTQVPISFKENTCSDLKGKDIALSIYDYFMGVSLVIDGQVSFDCVSSGNNETTILTDPNVIFIGADDGSVRASEIICL
jgi:hypothetical protein